MCAIECCVRGDKRRDRKRYIEGERVTDTPFREMRLWIRKSGCIAPSQQIAVFFRASELDINLLACNSSGLPHIAPSTEP